MNLQFIKEKLKYRMLDICGCQAINNIFDYMYISKKRKSPIVSKGSNEMYGYEYLLRKYSNYSKELYCSSEHGMPHYRLDNFSEYRDADYPAVLVHSKERRDIIQPYAKKLFIPVGPSFIPYSESIYNSVVQDDIKKSLGRTLVVYPQHNNDVTSFDDFMGNMIRLCNYIEAFKEMHGFDSVIICLYYIDVYRGLDEFYKKKGWRVVCAGHNTNYDFGHCLRTIMEIGDYTIAQGYSTIAYSVYLGKPATFVNGTYEQTKIDGKKAGLLPWQEKIINEMLELFSDYSENVTDKQIEYCNKRFGFDCVKTPEELNLIFRYLSKIRNVSASNVTKLRKIANRKEYKLIRDTLTDAIDSLSNTTPMTKDVVSTLEEEYAKIWK